MRWSDRFYRAVLRCYPAEFRDEYAREMAQAFRDRAAEDRAARLWLDLAADVATTAPKEHAHVLLVRDPATFAVVGLVLAIVALAACSIPARRAARVDPMVALRDE